MILVIWPQTCYFNAYLLEPRSYVPYNDLEIQSSKTKTSKGPLDEDWKSKKKIFLVTKDYFQIPSMTLAGSVWRNRSVQIR